jgi:hypothetical protein
MAESIILSTEEIITCPHCGRSFAIEQGITGQVIEKYKDAYRATLQESSQEIEGRLAKENAERMKKLKEETESKLRKEFDEERQSLKEDIKDKDAKIKTFRKNELELLREQKKLEEDKKNFELEKERELREAKKAIEKKVALAEAEKFELKEAEYKKKLEDALKANTDLARKLEQGSQQLQGEVLEQALEKILRESFIYDDISEIAKGVRGADVLQCVCTKSGQICGTIIWEAKRTRSWSDRWIQKVKDDCVSNNADIAVIVSTNLPKDCRELFTIREGVWLCSEKIVRPVAETLREILIQTSNLKIQSEGSSRKADLIYSYLASSQFAQNLRAVFQSFVDMETDLNREKRAMYKNWKKRELQLERVAVSMTNMVEQIQSIAQNSLPELDNIPQLSLPGELESE